MSAPSGAVASIRCRISGTYIGQYAACDGQVIETAGTVVIALYKEFFVTRQRNDAFLLNGIGLLLRKQA